MHIQERGANTILTTCTKMTEEVDIRHGMNGNSSGKTHDDAPLPGAAPSGSGGRLKFFKDGKFILELARTREGERVGWVSVQRKTFWPPAATATAPSTPPMHAQRHERATSLSVSDDNSSIQSSPWQRDHCWKQSNPRRNISKELTFHYCRVATLHSNVIHLGSKHKRRRPYDSTPTESFANGLRRGLTNGLGHDLKTTDTPHPPSKGSSEDVVDGKHIIKSAPNKGFHVKSDDSDLWNSEKYQHMKHRKAYQYHCKLKVYKKTGRVKKRKTIACVLELLKDKIASLPVPVNSKISSLNCRQEHMVSPRKRILRELERVSLEDQSSKRRAKTVPALSTASYPASPGPSHLPSTANVKPPETPPTKIYNGVGQNSTRRDSPVSKNVSSYSIHSLLSMKSEEESSTRHSPEAVGNRKSPQVYTPSTVKTESPSSINSPDLSPSPENQRYKYNLPCHRSSPVHYGGSPVHSLPPPQPDSPTPPLDHLSRFRSAYLPNSPSASAAFAPYPSPLPHKSPQYYPGILTSPSHLSSPHYRGSPTLKRSPVPESMPERSGSRYLPSPSPTRATEERAASRESATSLERPSRYSEARTRYREAPESWRPETGYALSPSAGAYLYPAGAYLPPYALGALPAAYRAPPPPMWMHYAVTPSIPPGPWAPLSHPLLSDHIPKEEPGSDVPLNLSKH